MHTGATLEVRYEFTGTVYWSTYISMNRRQAERSYLEPNDWWISTRTRVFSISNEPMLIPKRQRHYHFILWRVTCSRHAGDSTRNQSSVIHRISDHDFRLHEILGMDTFYDMKKGYLKMHMETYIGHWVYVWSFHGFRYYSGSPLSWARGVLTLDLSLRDGIGPFEG